jgi:DNA polymerase-3 subunit beta
VRPHPKGILVPTFCFLEVFMTLAITVSRKAFLAALQAVNTVVPSGTSGNVKPIHTNILLRVSSAGRIEIDGSDQQVCVRAVLEGAQVASSGSVLIPAHQLQEVLRESASPSVLLSEENQGDRQQVQVQLEDGIYHMPTMPIEQYPSILGMPENLPSVMVPAKRLVAMIRKTAFAVDREKSSPILQGVLFMATEGRFQLTATDGKVLSEAVCAEAKLLGLSGMQTIIPASGVATIARILDLGAVGDVQILAQNGVLHLSATLDTEGTRIAIQLSGRVIEGAFPPYRPALERTPLATAGFSVKELIQAVRRTIIFGSSNKGLVMQIEPGRAKLSNLNISDGTANIGINCQYQGEPMRLGWNAQFLQEVLKVLEQPDVTMEINGNQRGMVIREPEQTFLLMPISLPT